ncbi:MAG: glutamate 5-kinase [Candidatus Woesearchaeota archaeon]
MNIERLVVKIGSGFLFENSKNNDCCSVFKPEQMDCLVDELAKISDKKEIAVVSSGAMATAAYRQKLKELPLNDYEKAQLSGEGQFYLMNEYAQRFEKYGKRCAQILVCNDDFSNTKSRRNLRRNQEAYFRKGTIAIYNENDLVSIEEITFGDNDILAAKLACLIDADLLVILSNPVEELGKGGGKSKEEAKKIVKEKGINFEILNGQYSKDEKGNYEPKLLKLIF